MARISDLYMGHQDNIHNIDLVNKDEEARRLKLRLLSLRDENALLKDRVAQRDSRLNLFVRQGSEVQAELEEARENAKLQDARLKKQTNELTALKTELGSLNGSMQDSTKALHEKFALDRELNRLRPEIEHLKSQLVNHQAVIAEKQDLQRQLNSLEVELQNEKRSKQRLQQKNDAEVAGDWKTRLEAMEKKHASEKKEWEQAKKEHERDLREAQGENERLDDRVSTIKSKLKNVQSELKDARDELERCRADLEATRKVSRKGSDQPKKKVTMKAQPNRKRRVNDTSMDDISIGTPGLDEATFKRPLKKRAAELALVGEKSTFSITPFLSRTKNLSDESMDLPSPTNKPAGVPEVVMEEEEENDEEEEEEEEEEYEETHAKSDSHVLDEPVHDVLVQTKKLPDSKASKARGRPRKVLDEAPTLKKNMPSSSAQRMRTLEANSKPEKIAEEPESLEQENGAAKRGKKGLGLKAKSVESRPGSTSVLEADGKKKKRKILGSNTLFDEEEGETVPRPAKPALVAGRRLKAPLGGIPNAFGGRTFSPLKRDRRGFPIALPSPCLARSASSTSRWKQRQGRDSFARDAKVQGLKSRAAFKLLEMDAKYRIFKGNGQTVIDLGYAPGSWSQVAIERTRPHGRVIGIDLIPAQPPRGVTTFQGDFLSPGVQAMVKAFILDSHQRHPTPPLSPDDQDTEQSDEDMHAQDVDPPSYIDMERHAVPSSESSALPSDASSKRLVDVVLSDMSAPWEQTSGFNVNTLSNPYHRLMNTSGNTFRDHAGSMDLCTAALHFASDTLKAGGHFVCKFYQGSEDKLLEQKLKAMFAKVYREKPESSRKESKEAFFVALRRKGNATVEPDT
ncbi:FtsJ-like methyltransferase-domain-containing protein [Dactylonectria macrodidyma]|uniref:rRNA methyltransferase 2, mitochondrial n=1 Tax=Dactylonectria macrodidyma TaxID=307937 RepID=A0A9P9EYR3_9HYPO|nr:FtsJ-like methyltransferase-domain-containing protein [Dactylonectria macrodidyma]